MSGSTNNINRLITHYLTCNFRDRFAESYADSICTVRLVNTLIDGLWGRAGRSFGTTASVSDFGQLITARYLFK